MTVTGPALKATPQVVVGIDGSATSSEALRWAARIAPGIGAVIHAVTAWDLPVAYGWVADVSDWKPDVQAAQLLEETVDEVFGTSRPAGLVTSVRRGDVRDVLLDASKSAVMLVVGNRGHGGFAGLLLGSVSAACVAHAHCPVLVVHHGDAELAAWLP